MNTPLMLNDLLPHQAPMILIDALVSVGEKHIHCTMTSDERNLFFDTKTGAIPGWVGIEFMAQTIAAWSGYHALREQKKSPVGFLLGSRRYKSQYSEFTKGMTLNIYADHIMESHGMAIFACRIEHDGVEVASAQLNAYVPSEKKLAQMITRSND